MSRLFSRNAIFLGALACVSAGVGVLAACSSNSSPAGGNGDSGGTTSPQACSENVLPIIFNPAYSAFVTDNTSSTPLSFQIPAVVNDSAVDPTTLTWSASDSTVVSLAADPTTGGEMITVNKPGTVTIIATVQGTSSCGSSTLDITSATYAEWQSGSNRYNNGVALDFRCILGNTGISMDGGPCPDAGPACTQCHGPSANATTGFTDIAHTPEQTGGFSDQDLINIVINGVVPGCGTGTTCPTADSGYFDPTIIPYDQWQRFHHWGDIQGSDQEGMVVYLRSLTPTAQNGSADFGGQRDGGRYDGGHFEGGHGPHDGGFGPQPEAGADE
jgi:hypothetical protein